MNHHIKRFLQYRRNALLCVQQIRNGEWVLTDPYNGSYITATRGDVELWISNGPLHCEIYKPSRSPAFGHFWRHYVWWAAVRKFKADADRSVQRDKADPAWFEAATKETK